MTAEGVDVRKSLAVVAALVLLAAGACSDGDGNGNGGGGDAKGQTLPIGVDAPADGFAASWSHFFPHEVKAHPGDTLEFISHFTGEPHSVAFGTLIDEALAAFARLDPNAEPPAEIQAVLDKVPFVLSDEGGPDDLFVQAASQPCYLETADPPTSEACPEEQQQPPDTIDGKERFLSTGFMPDQDTAEFTLSETMAPGDYTFMCLVHGPDMTAKVTVVPEATAIPGPAEVETEGRHHLEEFLGTVRADVEKVQASTAAQAVAGVFATDENLPSSGINVLPREIDAKAGEKVTWEVNGFHTISFNAPEDARPWMQFDDKGVLVTNNKAFTPAASPEIPEPPPPPAGAPEDAPPRVPVDAGAWDGQGFHSSGAPFSGAQMVYSLAFSTPGTYQYLCLVHPDMEGTVKVS